MIKKSNYMKPRTTKVGVQNQFHLLASSGGQSNSRTITNSGQEGDPGQALTKNEYWEFN